MKEMTVVKLDEMEKKLTESEKARVQGERDLKAHVTGELDKQKLYIDSGVDSIEYASRGSGWERIRTSKKVTNASILRTVSEGTAVSGERMVHAVSSSLRVNLVKHTLSALNLLLLGSELGLLSLGLLPIFVSDFGKSTSMGLCPSLFLLLDPLLSPFNLLLHLVFSLLNQTGLEPLLELHVSYLLLLLLFKLLNLVFLHFL